jgi:hypothetical protein
MKRRTLLKAPALAAIPLLAQSSRENDVILKAMRDELQRSLKKLQLETLEKPYFLSYRIAETATVGASASFGALLSSNDSKRRLLSTECRVGSPERDNTNFFSMRLGVAGVIRIQADQGSGLPLDDDYDEYRRQLWLSTDSAYKQALDDVAKKRGALEHRTRTGDAPDFSVETPAKITEEAPAIAFNLAEAETLVKELSGFFRRAKGIDNSGVRLDVQNRLLRFVSSEGTEYLRSEPSLMLNWYGETQAADGMPISDVESLYISRRQDLPNREALAQKIQAFQQRLLRLKEAPLLTRYAGPVLFEGSAAAELVAQALAPALLGTPRLVVDDARFEGAFGSDAGTLIDKVGTRILPADMTLTDDPTQADLAGSYKVDEEGVPARSNVLIENGMLRQMLRTRALIAGVKQSSGNRRVVGVAPSNLLLQSKKGLAPAALRAELLRVVKDRGLEFGVIVRKIANPADQFARSRNRVIIITGGGSGAQGVPIAPVVEAYKVFPDGREELVRNLSISGFGPNQFRDILAAGQEALAYTAQFRNPRPSPMISGPITSGRMQVSYRVPALLFEDITLQRPSGEVPKAPFIGHPSFA